MRSQRWGNDSSSVNALNVYGDDGATRMLLIARRGHERQKRATAMKRKGEISPKVSEMITTERGVIERWGKAAAGAVKKHWRIWGRNR